ncbi:Rieske 2Fe-2S domain-containing protein [Amycolatopsis sp. NPDC005232]|uniref:Rieske 2Fe-2S domain-containing protein n=1 Tax=Amycolatopsis sp. NPDC005232 TaxID=3157027 RepID=UPI0033BF61C3
MTEHETPDESWHSLCAEEDLWEGEMSYQRLPEGTPVLLVNVDGRIRAYQGMCPHQENTLEDADFDGGVITCPAHLWEFDATDGAGINPANTRLREYPVVIRDGAVFVRVPAGDAGKVCHP